MIFCIVFGFVWIFNGSPDPFRLYLPLQESLLCMIAQFEFHSFHITLMKRVWCKEITNQKKAQSESHDPVRLNIFRWFLKVY